MTRALEPHLAPPSMRDVIRRLHEDGHEAAFVGGCVRDVLRGIPVADWDVGTSAVPETVLRLFPRAVPTGLKHGTVTIPTRDGPCEVTTYRIEAGYSDARRPDQVEFVGDVTRDLARRDFTVNAMAWDPDTGVLVDPFGGREDLARRVIRAVGDALDRFREDGLRPMRAARFAATLEFDLDRETEAALGPSRDRLALVAPERIRDELLKMLAAPKPSRGFEVLRRTGLLGTVLPELQACVAVPQNRYHAYDVYFHTLYTVDAAPIEKPIVRLAALFHDVGKPLTRAERAGDATFYNHEFESTRLAETAMTRLRFSRGTIAKVAHLVRHHMFDYRPEWTAAAVRRFVRNVGPDAIADLFDLRIADNIGNGLKTGFPHYLEELRGRVEEIFAAREALTLRELEIDGGDVMRELQLPPGPQVGRILAQLLEEVLENPARNRREWLLRRLHEGFSIDSTEFRT